MRQQYYVHNDILHNFACAIIYNAYNDYETAKRGMLRCFKHRHDPHMKYKFMEYFADYQDLKEFFRDNIWFNFLDIEPEYFKRLMEEKEHEDYTKENLIQCQIDLCGYIDDAINELVEDKE